MAGSKRFDIDIGVNASGVAKGAHDASMALGDLEDAVGDVADESKTSGNTVDSFSKKIVDAAREAGKSDDDIRDALRNYGVNAKDAERAIGRLGDEFKETGRDGKRGLDDLEDSLRDVQQQSKKTERSIDDIGSVGHKAFDKAAEGAEEFKNEAKQSVKETAASFSDVTDAVDLVQEVAANAFSGFGPAGVVAGAAAAIGIGAAVSGFEAVSKAEEESRERASEWAEAYVEAGGKILSAATTTGLALDIITDPEKFKTAQTNAKNWGTDVSTAVAAMAGETWALSAANEALSKQEEAAASNAVKLADGGEALADMLVGQTSEANAGRAALEQLNREMQLGGEQADAYSQYLQQVAKHTEGASKIVDEFGDSVVALPDGTTIYIDAETGQATKDTQSIEDKIYGIRDKHVTVSVGADVSAADRTIRRFINQGRQIKIGSRVIGPAGDGGNGGWNR